MVERLDVIANGPQILQVLKAAYRVEAELLGAGDSFPPLTRTLADLRAADSIFYGVLNGSQLCGVLEMEHGEPNEIASLGVAPDCFRRGIATSLLAHTIAAHGPDFLVTTGAENQPAITLYERFDFKITRRYRSPEGLQMVLLKC